MSNKDNLPVKYEKAGKPKVKEQVTQWVEQVEVFDGFSTDFGLLVEAIIFLVVGGGVVASLGAALPDNFFHLFLGAVGVLTFLGVALVAYDSWERRSEGGPVLQALYIIQSLLYGSALLICTTGILIGVLGSDLGIVVFIFGSLAYLPALALTYIEHCVETRTEERVVSSNGGEQL